MKPFPRPLSLHTLAALLMAALLSTACVSTKNAPTTHSAGPDTQHASNLGELFERARRSESPQREQYLLSAVNKLRMGGELEEAQKLLSNLFFGALPLPLKASYIIEYSELALLNNHPELALNALTSNQFNLYDYFDQLSPDSQIQLSEIKASAYESAGNYLAGARERIYFNSLLQPPAKQQNEAIIWQDLNQLSIQTLYTLALNAPTNEFRGWLELAHLNKNHQHNIDQQHQSLNQWLTRWHNHASAKNLPKNLELLSKYTELRPKKIALFLPLKGKLSKPALAIQDGILAAHYNALQTSTETPEITLYDTSQTADMNRLYQQATAEGAELIIGPLEKQHVNSILKLPRTEIPILALNYATNHAANSTDNSETIDPSNPATNDKEGNGWKNVFQFGLLPEDDAKQVALKAWQDGHRNVAILHPESIWGTRVSQAFVNYWQTLGGEVTSNHSFDPQHGFANPIKQLLNIDKSEQRAKLLKQNLNTKFEFSVRRRKDIDFIFLLATPKQARQIKPTLAFYYANEIPVYATAHLYEGQTKNPERDRDMNGIIFCDIPWALKQDDPVKSNSLAAWPDNPNRYQRLVALGVDAYRLHSRLAILAAAPSSKVYGATGVLTLQEENRFQRNLLWAKIVNGKARIIQTFGNQTDPQIIPSNDNEKRQLNPPK